MNHAVLEPVTYSTPGEMKEPKMTPTTRFLRPCFLVVMAWVVLVTVSPAVASRTPTMADPSGSKVILAQAVSASMPAATPVAGSTQAKAKGNANLRGGPGTGYPIAGQVKAGQSLDIVARNRAGDWYRLANGRWISGALVENPPKVPADTNIPPPPVQAAAPAPKPAGQQWVQVADSAADFPGGPDHNNWYYLWTDGRNNFNWQPMAQSSPQDCYRDAGGRGLEICRDTIKADPSGDVGLQWKANRGGTYRFEWDAASLKFYQHANLVGMQGKGSQLPYAATIQGVIDWEMFFWVAADSTPFHVRVFRLDDSGAQGAAQPTPQPLTGGSALGYTDGIGIVGVDIPAGTYRSLGRGSCYWERLSGFGGTSSEIIANDYASGPKVVTISAADKGFWSKGCVGWTLDLSPITASPTAPFRDGTYFVHKDVAPGTWQSSSRGSCYWERLSGFSGEFRDIMANDYVTGPTLVGITPGDTGFHSRGCGTWTRIN
jgi:hypothetical protein